MAGGPRLDNTVQAEARAVPRNFIQEVCVCVERLTLANGGRCEGV